MALKSAQLMSIFPRIGTDRQTCGSKRHSEAEMNANQIINMIMRTVMRNVINKGVNVGIDKAFGKGKARDDMTPEERQRADGAKKHAGNAQKAMRMARRAGRF
ncbi:hypothetical protein [Roseivivax sp. CAU 1753]